MKGLQYSTSHEIEEAKRIMFEADDTTRATFFSSIAALLSLVVMLVVSLLGIQESWTCELDSDSAGHAHICPELEKSFSCGRSIAGPIKSEVLLAIGNQVEASAFIVCPWEHAISELRVCFIFVSLMSVLCGLLAIKKENRRYAELHCYSACFFAGLLFIAAFFDYLSVSDSQLDNESYCNNRNEFPVGADVKEGSMVCTFTLYNFTTILGFVSALLMSLSAFMVSSWKSTLTEENF
mmetsp:Transcript_27495/g.31698  ORF Transcript_27495/g.31698 Transcript_27495/m.31698 type:complete len:237 (+) Transcript_27495:32-742(+)